jgi:hypothetical protein
MAKEQSSATKVAGGNKKFGSNFKSLSIFLVSKAANEFKKTFFGMEYPPIRIFKTYCVSV